MICNPFWPDIISELLAGQTAQDRPGIRDGFRVESSRVRVEHRTGLPCSKLEIIEFDRADPFTRLELENFDRAEGAVRLELDMLEI
jgi:hypothetical protein